MIPICDAFEAKPRGEIAFAFPHWVVLGPRLTSLQHSAMGNALRAQSPRLLGLAQVEPYRTELQQTHSPHAAQAADSKGGPVCARHCARHRLDKEEEQRIQRLETHITQPSKVLISILPSSSDDWPLRSLSLPLTPSQMLTINMYPSYFPSFSGRPVP